MLYRIFTEDKNQDEIEKIVSRHFPGYTIFKAAGFWRLQKENSLIVEIITEDSDAKINKIATDIKKCNKQETVLVQKIKNNQWLI
jgi:hypothetical protein